MTYLLLKQFPRRYIEDQIKIVQDLYLDVAREFDIREMSATKDGKKQQQKSYKNHTRRAKQK